MTLTHIIHILILGGRFFPGIRFVQNNQIFLDMQCFFFVLNFTKISCQRIVAAAVYQRCGGRIPMRECNKKKKNKNKNKKQKNPKKVLFQANQVNEIHDNKNCHTIWMLNFYTVCYHRLVRKLQLVILISRECDCQQDINNVMGICRSCGLVDWFDGV